MHRIVEHEPCGRDERLVDDSPAELVDTADGWEASRRDALGKIRVDDLVRNDGRRGDAEGDEPGSSVDSETTVQARSRARRARVTAAALGRHAHAKPSAGVAGIDDIAFTSVISSPILSASLAGRPAAAVKRPDSDGSVDRRLRSSLASVPDCRTSAPRPNPMADDGWTYVQSRALRPAATLRWGGVRATVGHRACRHVCDPSAATRSGCFDPLGRISAPACVVPVRWSVSGSSPWRRS